MSVGFGPEFLGDWLQDGASTGEEETRQAFAKHFAEQLDLYGSQVLVSLVEQTGKEKVLADAYLNHVLLLDDPRLTYVSFDFHEYWCVLPACLFGNKATMLQLFLEWLTG